MQLKLKTLLQNLRFLYNWHFLLINIFHLSSLNLHEDMFSSWIRNCQLSSLFQGKRNNYYLKIISCQKMSFDLNLFIFLFKKCNMEIFYSHTIYIHKMWYSSKNLLSTLKGKELSKNLKFFDTRSDSSRNRCKIVWIRNWE